MADLIDRATVIAFVKDRIRHATASDLSGATFRLHEAQEIRAFIAALPAVTVGVKPLVWEEQAGRSYRQANSIFGQYQISWLVEFECWQLFCPPKQGAEWKTAFARFAHKDHAKAAAQADYEARILAALDPAPQPAALAVPKSASDVIQRQGAEATAAAMLLHIAETLRTKGKAVLTTSDDFGAQVLEYADAIAAPREGGQG